MDMEFEKESKKIDFPCTYLKIVCGVALPAFALLAVAGYMIDTSWMVIAGVTGAAAVLILSQQRVKCWADSEGFVISKPFKAARKIPYRDIKKCYIALRTDPTPVEGRPPEFLHSMHIVTKSEDLHFDKISGTILSPDMVYDDIMRKVVLDRSPFAEIVKMVQANCPPDPLSDYLHHE